MQNFKAFRMAFVGPASSGKTCLIERMFHSEFMTDTVPTVCRKHNVTFSYEQEVYVLQVHDFNPSNKPLLNEYLENADVVAFIFSTDSVLSFLQMEKLFIYYIDHFHHKKRNAILLTIATKCDSAQNEVRKDDLRNLIRGRNVAHFNVSAKENRNVQELFQAIIVQCAKVHERCLEAKLRNHLKK